MVGAPPSRPWSRLLSWIAGRSTVADARALLQRRVALFFQVQLALSALNFLWERTREMVEHGGLDGELIADNAAQFMGHGSVILIFCVLWLYCRQGSRSAPALHWLEGGATVLICLLSAVAFLEPARDGCVPDGAPKAWQLFLINLVILVTRAALVPSSATRSLLVGFAAISPICVVSHVGPTSAPGLSVWTFPSETVWTMVGFGTSFVVVTAVTSRTIYGLQARVREAMRLGQYTLEEKLGQGGMGVVYRARHAMLRRPTALKLLPQGESGEEALARFEQEVQLTAELSHPNTITIFDYGRTSEGVFYYAMELLDGATLEEVVARAGAMPPARVHRVLLMVAGALTEAHERGLIHRDIKPSNIFLCRQGGSSTWPRCWTSGWSRPSEAPATPGSRRRA